MIQGISLHSLRGHQDGSGQRPERVSRGSAKKVPQLDCAPIQVPKQYMKAESDEGSSGD